MSNTPGISPLTADLERVRHSDDERFDDPMGKALKSDDPPSLLAPKDRRIPERHDRKD